MAKKDPFDLSKDGRGNFKRSIGVKLVDGEFKKAEFYLGRDRSQACINSLNLEKAWDAVHDKWYRLKDGPRATWDDTTLTIGKAIGLGKKEVVLTYPMRCQEDFAVELKLWLVGLQERFPWVKVVPADDPVNALVEKTLDLKQQALAITERLAASRREELSILRPTNQATGPKLAEALDAYLVNVQTKKREMDGTVSDFGGLVGRRIKNMKEHLADKDITLDKVNIKFLDEWLTCWENRPTGKRGGPVSKLWAEGIIATIRAFVRWLNMSDDFAWEKLRQYEVTPITVKDTEEELARTPSRNRYKRSELPALYEYASPRERVFILLALNCGFGEGEISTLARNEIVFGDEKSYIKRRRRKTKVFTQWLLWPETVEALKWYLAKVRPKSDSLYVFISEKGRPIKERTKGNNRSQYIANGWERVYKRIVKDRPDFFKLSFNKLRKTGSNWIRMKYGKELADLYLGHGKKEVVDAYTEKRFGPMFQATRHYRKVIGPMFQAVPVPFPEDARKSNPSLSRAKMKKLQERRDQGYTIKKIAEVEQVSPQTVMRYTTKPTKAK